MKARFAPGLDKERLSGSLYKLLSENYGQVIESADEEISSLLIEDDISSKLSVSPALQQLKFREKRLINEVIALKLLGQYDLVVESFLNIALDAKNISCKLIRCCLINLILDCNCKALTCWWNYSHLFQIITT